MKLIPQTLRIPRKSAPPGQITRERSEAVHRLQVGFLGLAVMVLLVGVADIIMDRARQTDDTTPPQAASTVAPRPEPGQNDALANAGVVPDLPKEAQAEPIPEGPVLPEQGNTLDGN